MDPQVIAAQQTHAGIVPGVGMSGMGMGMGMMDPYAQQAPPPKKMKIDNLSAISWLGFVFVYYYTW